MKRKGFTLAEVLITLGIIGVVAAVAIPVLMSNIQNFEFKTAMKKNYSILSEAYLMIVNDNGGSFYTGCDSYDHTCLKNLFKSKLHYIKECDAGAALGMCGAARESVKTLNHADDGSTWAYADVLSGLILKDGSSVLFYNEVSNCSVYSAATGYHLCGWFTIDVNGLKSPNTWGKDLYHFWITTTGVVPVDTKTNGDQYPCDGSSQDTGHLCSSKYVSE